MFVFHEELTGFIDASIAEVFAALDDHTRLSSHMNERSWRMGWGTMETLPDAQLGKAVGSHITMRGRVLGISLHLDEVVTSREPPFGKQWETVGVPHLLVIGAYQMRFELRSEGTGSSLRVTLDYDLPPKGISRVLGKMFGHTYARWCTRQMIRDAQLIAPAEAATPESPESAEQAR
jgi:hypothetical protein